MSKNYFRQRQDEEVARARASASKEEQSAHEMLAEAFKEAAEGAEADAASAAMLKRETL